MYWHFFKKWFVPCYYTVFEMFLFHNLVMAAFTLLTFPLFKTTKRNVI